MFCLGEGQHLQGAMQHNLQADVLQRLAILMHELLYSCSFRSEQILGPLRVKRKALNLVIYHVIE